MTHGRSPFPHALQDAASRYVRVKPIVRASPSRVGAVRRAARQAGCIVGVVTAGSAVRGVRSRTSSARIARTAGGLPRSP
ncbi:hypothetical protein Plo01_45160 [Planobispora longispora]|uniref:Uncharacterized protein n=1 Tax=Planobispora longispora TaxID=28887 RepID=A0A8J3RQL0_9ACTN|nr:hypothetical protein GCM10020093_022230 [Planobispora longispora]GIH78087.1 hypothetical protein Plo01_45160 [Planobispora longispora]